MIARLIKKTLYIGVFAFIIGNFNNLAEVIFNSFASLGLKAGGGALTPAQLLQPGRLAQVGIFAAAAHAQRAADYLHGLQPVQQAEAAE